MVFSLYMMVVSSSAPVAAHMRVRIIHFFGLALHIFDMLILFLLLYSFYEQATQNHYQIWLDRILSFFAFRFQL